MCSKKPQQNENNELELEEIGDRASSMALEQQELGLDDKVHSYVFSFTVPTLQTLKEPVKLQSDSCPEQTVSSTPDSQKEVVYTYIIRSCDLNEVL